MSWYIKFKTKFKGGGIEMIMRIGLIEKVVLRSTIRMTDEMTLISLINRYNNTAL